jgi:hypothetical protein
LGAVIGCGGEENASSQSTGATDDRNAVLGIVCDADLTVAGTFAASAPQPVDVIGCWPVGTWTFTLAVTDNRCPTPPDLRTSYRIEVSQDADGNQRYTDLDDPNNPSPDLRVTSGGSGLCEGSFRFYSADGKTVTNVTSNLHADNIVDGHGEYEIRTEDQRL